MKYIKQIMLWMLVLVGLILSLGCYLLANSEELFPRTIAGVLGFFGLLFIGVAILEWKREYLLRDQRKRIYIAGLISGSAGGGGVLSEIWIVTEKFPFFVWVILSMAGLSLVIVSMFGGPRIIEELNIKLR